MPVLASYAPTDIAFAAVEGIVNVELLSGVVKPVPMFNAFSAGSHISNLPFTISVGISLNFHMPDSI